jgi:ankyrin repeat protein
MCQRVGLIRMQVFVLLHGRGGKDTNVNKKGECAVHIAAAAGHVDCVLYLLKNMSSYIDNKDAEGRTPLSLVVERDHFDLVKIFVARGADAVYTRTKGGVLLDT